MIMMIIMMLDDYDDDDNFYVNYSKPNYVNKSSIKICFYLNISVLLQMAVAADTHPSGYL